jgi:hypothetical protein
MLGLGLTLLSMCDWKHGWRWHAMNVLIFCVVHFIRTVHKLIPESRYDTSHIEARDQLISLTTCQTAADHATLCAAIKG